MSTSSPLLLGIVTIALGGCYASHCEEGVNGTWLKRDLDRFQEVPDASWGECAAAPAVGYLKRPDCNAVVLDDHTILTAAHCLSGTPTFHLHDETTAIALAPEHCIHPSYSPTCLGYCDLAVARLSEAIPEVPTIDVESLRDASGAAGAHRAIDNSPLADTFIESPSQIIAYHGFAATIASTSLSGQEQCCTGLVSASFDGRFDLVLPPGCHHGPDHRPLADTGISGASIFGMYGPQGVALFGVVSHGLDADDPRLVAQEIDVAWLADARRSLDTNASCPSDTPKAAPLPRSPKFFSADFRANFIPKGILNLFFDGATSIWGLGGDMRIGYAFGNLELSVGPSYFHFGFDPTLFKRRGAPDTDWEFVSGDLHALLVSGELAYFVPLDSHGIWSFFFGASLSVGGVLGHLVRTQAYPNGSDQRYKPCARANDADAPAGFCSADGVDGEHYGKDDRTWIHGGSKPDFLLLPTLPKLGIEWRLPHNLLDVAAFVGASLMGVSFGADIKAPF